MDTSKEILKICKAIESHRIEALELLDQYLYKFKISQTYCRVRVFVNKEIKLITNLDLNDKEQCDRYALLFIRKSFVESFRLDYFEKRLDVNGVDIYLNYSDGLSFSRGLENGKRN